MTFLAKKKSRGKKKSKIKVKSNFLARSRRSQALKNYLKNRAKATGEKGSSKLTKRSIFTRVNKKRRK
jgi:hypothetical protein